MDYGTLVHDFSNELTRLNFDSESISQNIELEYRVLYVRSRKCQKRNNARGRIRWYNSYDSNIGYNRQRIPTTTAISMKMQSKWVLECFRIYISVFTLVFFGDASLNRFGAWFMNMRSEMHLRKLSKAFSSFQLMWEKVIEWKEKLFLDFLYESVGEGWECFQKWILKKYIKKIFDNFEKMILYRTIK